MGLALLDELQERLHTAAVAGVSVIGEDFRLCRVIEQLEKVAASSPLLGRVYKQVLPLISPDSKNKGILLIDAIGLVDAIVYTQASYQIDGTIEPITVLGEGMLTQCKYSDIEPLKTALLEKGSGRYDIIYSAYSSKQPAISDFRIIAPLLKALGDTYAELSDLIKCILQEKGESILPLLKHNLDSNGGRDMLKRYELIIELSKSKENDLYLTSIEHSSPPIKEACIKALSYKKDNDEKLIELAISEKGNTKKAALFALSRMNTPNTDAFWLSQLKKKTSNAEAYLIINKSNTISDILADNLDSLLDQILDVTLYGNGKKIPEVLCSQLTALIMTLPNKSSPKMLHVLKRIAQNNKYLSSLKGENNQCLLHSLAANLQEVGKRDDFMTLVRDRIAAGLAYSQRPDLIEFIYELHSQTGNAYVTPFFIAKLLSDPEGCFDYFYPYFKEQELLNQIMFGFNRIVYETDSYEFVYWMNDNPPTSYWSNIPFAKTLDPRWLMAMMEKKNNYFNQLMQKKFFNDYDGNLILVNLINPNDENTLPTLRTYYYKKCLLGQGRSYLYALKECGFTDFKELIPKYIERVNRFSYYELQDLYRDLPMNPQTRIDELMLIADKMKAGKVSSDYSREYNRIKELAERLEKGYGL